MSSTRRAIQKLVLQRCATSQAAVAGSRRVTARWNHGTAKPKPKPKLDTANMQWWNIIFGAFCVGLGYYANDQYELWLQRKSSLDTNSAHASSTQIRGALASNASTQRESFDFERKIAAEMYQTASQLEAIHCEDITALDVPLAALLEWMNLKLPNAVVHRYVFPNNRRESVDLVVLSVNISSDQINTEQLIHLGFVLQGYLDAILHSRTLDCVAHCVIEFLDWRRSFAYTALDRRMHLVSGEEIDSSHQVALGDKSRMLPRAGMHRKDGKAQLAVESDDDLAFTI